MRKAGDILSAFFDERLSKEGQTYSSLFKSWNHIAGDQLSAHSRIAELDRNILLVEADHPGWIMILQSREQELLERVRRSFPDLVINGISFRLSKTRIPVDSQNLPEFSKKTALQDTSQDDEKSMEGQKPTEVNYERIQDPQFKEILKRLEQSIKSKHT